MCVAADPPSSDGNANELNLPPAERRTRRSPTARSRFASTPAPDTYARNMALNPAERNRDAIDQVTARMRANEARVTRNNPLVPGGTFTGALYTASNFFNARIIDSLQRGATPVMDASGTVTGARDSRGRLTGRDPVAEEAAAKIRDRQNQDEADARRRAEEAAAAVQPNPASATAPAVPSTNRRPIIYDDQRLSSAASRGPGRRSLLGP